MDIPCHPVGRLSPSEFGYQRRWYNRSSSTLAHMRHAIPGPYQMAEAPRCGIACAAPAVNDDVFSVRVHLGQQAREARGWLHSIACTPTAACVGTVCNPYLLLGIITEPG